MNQYIMHRLNYFTINLVTMALIIYNRFKKIVIELLCSRFITSIIRQSNHCKNTGVAYLICFEGKRLPKTNLISICAYVNEKPISQRDAYNRIPGDCKTAAI